MLLGQLRKKVEAARQANRHEHHDQVPGDINRGRVHETHRVGLQYFAGASGALEACVAAAAELWVQVQRTRRVHHVIM